MRAVYLFCLVWVLQETPHIASAVELEACPHEMISVSCPSAGTDVTILNDSDQRADGSSMAVPNGGGNSQGGSVSPSLSGRLEILQSVAGSE